MCSPKLLCFKREKNADKRLLSALCIGNEGANDVQNPNIDVQNPNTNKNKQHQNKNPQYCGWSCGWVVVVGVEDEGWSCRGGEGEMSWRLRNEVEGGGWRWRGEEEILGVG